MALGGILGAAAGGVVGRAVVEVVGDSAKLRGDLEKAKAQTNTATTAMGRTTSKLSGLAVASYATIGTAIVGFVGASIKAASSLGEQLNRVREVFSGTSDQIIKFSESSAESLGISQAAALDAAASFGAIFDSAGLAEKASAGMSTRLVTLAADMASFNDQDPTEMLTRLRAGLSGEAEPLRRFGVFIDEARVKAEAYASGIAEVGEELTVAQKVQARFNVIFQDTTKQQGDFARTVGDSLPNQLRKAQAMFIDLTAAVGQQFLPAAKAVVGVLNVLMPLIKPITSALLALAGAFIAVKVAAAVGAALVSLGAALEGFAIVRGLGTAVGLFGIQLASLGPHLIAIAGLIASLTLIIQNWKAAFEGVGVSIAGALSDDFYAALGKAAAGTAGLTGKLGLLAAAHDENTAAAQGQLAAELALGGGVVGVAAAVDAASDSERTLAEARAEVARLLKEGKEGTEEYKAAVEAVGDAARGSVQSQFALAGAVEQFAEEASKTGDVQGAIDRVRDFGQKAGLTKAEINKMVDQVKAAIRELGKLPGAKKVDFSTPGLPDMLNRVQTLQNRLANIPATVSTRFIISGDEINPRGGAMGAIIPAQHGLIARGPTMLVGEGRYSTFAGKGAEAIIPLDNRGLNILARAMELAAGRASAAVGTPVIHQHVSFAGATFIGDKDVPHLIAQGMGQLRRRYSRS